MAANSSIGTPSNFLNSSTLKLGAQLCPACLKDPIRLSVAVSRGEKKVTHLPCGVEVVDEVDHLITHRLDSRDGDSGWFAVAKSH